VACQVMVDLRNIYRARNITSHIPPSDRLPRTSLLASIPRLGEAESLTRALSGAGPPLRERSYETLIVHVGDIGARAPAGRVLLNGNSR
jgi:hypothetical protein